MRGVLFLVGLFLHSHAFADEPVVVQEKERIGWRALGVPFAIPPLAVAGLAYPLKSFANWAEEIDLKDRAVDFFFNDEKTAYWFPTFRTGGSAGFMAGVNAGHRDLFHQGYRGSLLWQASPAWDQDANLSMFNSHFMDRNISTGISLSMRRRQEDQFFGTGNNTSDREFKYESAIFGAELPMEVRIFPSFRWEVFGRFLGQKTSDNPDPTFALVPNFAAAQREGLGEWISAGEFGTRLKLDTRSNKGIPDKGIRSEVSFSRLEGTDSFGFYRLKARVSQYFTLFLPDRVLAIGARFESVFNPDNDRIPFTLLPSLGGPANLRGFDELRFRDKVALIIGGEYRYPVWKLIDGFLFLESGRVASSISNLGWTGFHPSYGGGLRFRTRDQFFFQLQGAASSEGVKFVFSFNQSL